MSEIENALNAQKLVCEELQKRLEFANAEKIAIDQMLLNSLKENAQLRTQIILSQNEIDRRNNEITTLKKEIEVVRKELETCHQEIPVEL